MRFRKLRIAWSAVCGVIGLLLIALCVRSYRNADTVMLQTTTTRGIQIDSARGVVSFEFLYWFDAADPSEMEFSSEPIEPGAEDKSSSPLGFSWEVARGADGGSHTLAMPSWFLALMFTTFAAAPWLRGRFSLRTLLIATTLVAVLLGLAVYVTRR